MTRVTKDLGPSETPTAARASTSPWRDPRLWTGVALVAGSIVVGGQVLAAADDTTEVWAARADLAAGARVTAHDLVTVGVKLDRRSLARYLVPGDELPDDALLHRVAAGELMAESAFGDAAAGLVAVPLAVAVGSAPSSLAVGSHVDVWVTSADRSEPAAPALDGVIVLEAPAVDEVLGGGGERRLVVGVPAAQDDGIGQVLAAGHDGRIALTVEP